MIELDLALIYGDLHEHMLQDQEEALCKKHQLNHEDLLPSESNCQPAEKTLIDRFGEYTKELTKFATQQQEKLKKTDIKKDIKKEITSIQTIENKTSNEIIERDQNFTRYKDGKNLTEDKKEFETCIDLNLKKYLITKNNLENLIATLPKNPSDEQKYNIFRLSGNELGRDLGTGKMEEKSSGKRDYRTHFI